MPALCELKTDFFKLAKEYAGRWVALHSQTGDLVAAGDSPGEVLEAAMAAGVKDPIITQVADDYGAFVTCLA
jgi:hypothetical protein